MTRRNSFGDYQDSVVSYGSYIRSDSSTGEHINKMYRSLKIAAETMLTGRQRDCLELYYDRRFTADEIADELGISKSTVYKHLRRAREKLYGLMKCYQ